MTRVLHHFRLPRLMLSRSLKPFSHTVHDFLLRFDAYEFDVLHGAEARGMLAARFTASVSAADALSLLLYRRRVSAQLTLSVSAAPRAAGRSASSPAARGAGNSAGGALHRFHVISRRRKRRTRSCSDRSRGHGEPSNWKRPDTKGMLGTALACRPSSCTAFNAF